MAVVSVTADATRVTDAESATGWNNIGGGAGGAAEGSFPYQGNNLFNRKVTSSSGSGFYYNGAAAQDMTATSTNTWLVKMIVTDYGGLQTANGLRPQIGTSTSAYYEYVIAGTSAKIATLEQYPPKGGLVIVPINPNVAGYRDSTTGSPNLASVDYFGTVAAFLSSTAKSENVGCDAIDLGTGLTVVGGDGGDPDATFQDFLDFDEGTSNNRYGFVTESNGVLFCFGTLTIGNATATVFNDSDSQVLFLDGYFDSGYAGVSVDLQNASTVVTIANTINSLGTDTVVDTRADFTVSGTSGTLSLTGGLLNHRNITLTSACTVSGVLEFEDLTTSTATISGATLRTRSASGVAAINDYSATDLTGCSFEQIGSGHAIEITSAGTYSLDALQFTGFGADGTNSAAIYNNSGGAVTLNIINGGDTPTFRNGAGASTTVNNTVTVGVTVVDLSGTPIENARVLILAGAGGDLTEGATILSGLTDASGRLESTGFNYTNTQAITGRVRKASGSPYYKTSNIIGTIGANGFDATIQMLGDE